MFKKILLFSMIDFVDIFHYLIGILVVSFLVWLIIKVHTYFSKNNIPLEQLMGPIPMATVPQ